MVNTPGIPSFLTCLLREDNEVVIPATTFFIIYYNNKIELVKTEGYLFIQRDHNDNELIKVYFFHNNTSKDGAVPADADEILNKYHCDFSWWMLSLDSPKEEYPNCDIGWAYICFPMGNSTITIENHYAIKEILSSED